jgi:hypothetical protein
MGRLGRLVVGMLAVLSTATAWSAGASASSRSSGPTPPYLTLLLAHSAWTAVDANCQPLKGIVPLRWQASEYAARHLTITASVVTGWVAPTTRTCIVNLALSPAPKPLLIASWADLAMLQSDFGWKFVSQGRQYEDLLSLPRRQQDSDICGSLRVLEAHGFPEAAGLFAYPNNHYDLALQRQIVDRCYDFGRIYASTDNSQAKAGPPWFAKTFSFNGGRCNNPQLSCFTLPTRFAYGSPASLLNDMNPGPGQWSIVQLYRFAVGANTSGSTLQWDCTGPNWQDHWTAGPDATELYCWKDFVWALKQINPSVVTIDPAGVAAAWGRSLGG